MAFKSLIIFALVASVGRVMAAPLAGGHLNARSFCQGIRCTRYIAGGGHPDLSRRLAEYEGNNVTLSSGTPGKPTSVVSSSTLPNDPSSTPSLGDPATESPKPTKPSGRGGDKPPSSTSDETPQATEPAAGGPVTITLTSTVFVNPTDPAVSLPTQSPAPSNSVVSSSLAVDPSLAIPADGGSPSLSLTKPSGISTSVSPPNSSLVKDPLSTSTNVNSIAAPLPTIIELTNGAPSSTLSSSPAGQPTPSTTTGIIFLPPSGEGATNLNP